MDVKARDRDKETRQTDQETKPTAKTQTTQTPATPREAAALGSMFLDKGSRSLFKILLGSH